MQLDQPIPPPYPGGDGQYDFILNGNQKPKKTLLPKAKSRKQRMLFAVVAGLVLFTLFIIVLSLIFSIGKGASKSLVAIAQAQNEIIRVSNAGAIHSRDTTTQGFAQNTALVVVTSQKQTLSYLSSHGNAVNSKDLALSKNTKTDAILTAADEAGRYDEQLSATLKQELTDYQNQVNQAYKQTSSKSQRQLLQQLYNQVVLLLKNQPATSS